MPVQHIPTGQLGARLVKKHRAVNTDGRVRPEGVGGGVADERAAHVAQEQRLVLQPLNLLVVEGGGVVTHRGHPLVGARQLTAAGHAKPAVVHAGRAEHDGVDATGKGGAVGGTQLASQPHVALHIYNAYIISGKCTGFTQL